MVPSPHRAGSSVLLGRRTTDAKKKLYLPSEDRQYHLHVLGRFGLGKSKFLEHLIRQDILSGQGLCLVDPHGSLYDDIVKWCAANDVFRRRKVLLFHPAEQEWSFGFNPLDFSNRSADAISDAVDNMVKACAQVWGGEDTDRTPRLARILSAIFFALGEQGLTLREATDLLAQDMPMQRLITANIDNPIVREEWEYLRSVPPAQYVEQTESARNRLSRFLRNPSLRTMVSQTQDTIDFSSIMDEGTVVLVNLQGLTSENQRLLGSLMVNEIATKAALRKPDTSRPFFVYIDECYQFLNDDVEKMITGLRKFGIRLTLAHQNLGQLKQAGGEAVFSSVMQIGNKVVFGGLPIADVELMAKDIFLGSIDYEEAKHTLDKPTVTRYIRSWLKSHSDSSSSTGSEGLSESTVEMAGTAADPGALPHTESIGSSLGSAATLGQAYSESSVFSASETLEPVLESLPTQVFSLEEQIHRAMATLAGQPTRYAVVKLAGRPPEQILAPYVEEAVITDEYVAKKKLEIFEQTEFAVPRTVAEERLEERRAKLLSAAKKLVNPPEPEDWEG